MGRQRAAVAGSHPRWVIRAGAAETEAETTLMGGATMAQRSYAESKASGWTVGFVLFAGIMMITIGVFQVIAGFAAILEDKFYVVAPNYTYEFDVTTWGWIHLILG